MGFGGTDAPPVSLESPEPSIAFYSFKRAADDIKELARQLGAPKLILGGHDWGGAIVYRIALWHPELVTRMFVVCTPYNAPASTFMSTEDIVKTRLPNFGYQLQLATGAVEKHIQTKEDIKKFLNALYGGRGLNGELGFDVEGGAIFRNLDNLEMTKWLSEEMLSYYADQYAKNGMHGTLCWYRNRQQNFQDELQLKKRNLDVPVLFIQATKDAALPPAMSKGMEHFIPHLTRKSVPTGHWALWEAPQQVNDMVKEWLKLTEGLKSNL